MQKRKNNCEMNKDNRGRGSGSSDRDGRS